MGLALNRRQASRKKTKAISRKLISRLNLTVALVFWTNRKKAVEAVKKEFGPAKKTAVK